MKHSFKAFIGAAAVASIVFAAGSAQADPLKCHAAIGKNITKYQATLAKNLIGCHKSRNGAKIGNVDCNDAIVADIKLKRTANRDKAKAGIAKACVIDLTDDGNDETTVRALYPRCPSPSATSDDGGVTTGIDTFTELGNCLLDLSEEYIERVGLEVMGLPTGPFPLAKGPTSCHGALGKNLSKIIKTAGGIYSKCQAGQEKLDMDLDFDASCIGAAADTSAKLSGALTAMDTAITTSCAVTNMPNQAAWAALGTCGQSIAIMQECAVDRVLDPTSRGLAAAALELPGTCASVADVVINAGYGQKISNTRLDSGWKGSAHAVDVIDDSLGAVSLGACNPDCENCPVTHNSKNDNCRCSNDATAVCDVINGPDVDDCGGNTCHCMFGPPLAISASSTPVCVVNRFFEEFDGQTGVVGEYSVATTTNALVHTGLSQTQPCPTCEGGQCDGGLRDNLACTVDATHPDFGPVSYDCPPSPGANISGSGLLLALNFSSGTQSLTAAIPAAGTFCDGADACHCSVCTGNAKIGCSTDAPCIAAGAGTCGAVLGNNPQQNNCDAGGPDCINDGDGNGECSSGPIDTFCTGFTHGNGEGILACSTDLDCDANDCDGDGFNNSPVGECGTCGLAGARKCFLPTVTATGTPGIYNSEGISVFCSGQTGNGGVDNAGGLPGPGRVTLDFDFNLYCANGTTQFQLPSGSNCIP